MKKLLNLIFTFLMITNVFFGCKLEEAPDLPPPPEPEKEYILNLSEIEFNPWDENNFSYDETKNKIKLSKNYTGGEAWINYNNTFSFNYFYIEYESNYSFQINLVYSDNSITETILSPFETKKIINLDISKINYGF